MNRSFNLLDEPWLPVSLKNSGVRDFGLLEVFERADAISGLAETAPPSLIAQYRLLLAITHRALSCSEGRWTDSDRLRWYQNGLPLDVIRDYLERWRDRFWLFDPQQPFMQVAALATAEQTRDKQKPWTQISLASANGNAPVMFDHSCDLTPVPTTPANALRTLLGFLQFTPGGLVKSIRDSDKAGALANTAAVIPLGSSLSQTLCLALHPPSPQGHEDLPCWEQNPPVVEQLLDAPILATGPNDRYSRLSRAVLLSIEQGRVSWLRFAAGIALGDDVQAPDPMASYRAGSNGLIRISFAEGRAFWRDLPALLPDAAGLASQSAAVLGWAANLQVLLGSVEQPLLVAGVSSDQAKLLRWRAERITLPTALLESADCANELRRQVRAAEDLYADIRRLAVGMLADTLPDPTSKDTRARARDMFDAGPAPGLFFAAVERSLGKVMALLAAGDVDEADTIWTATLQLAGRAGWQAARDAMGNSPRALRADAKFFPRLMARLRALRPAESDQSVADTEARA